MVKHNPDDILNAAVSLFDDQGVGVSTAQVAKAAGVANGTLFNYFPTKQALIDAMYVKLKTELAMALSPVDPSDGVRQQCSAIWTSWVAWATRNPDRHRVALLLRDSGLATEAAAQEAAELFVEFGAVFDSAYASGVFVDLPQEYLSALVELHLDLAVRSALTRAQLDTAFDAMWNSIAATTASTTTTGEQR